MAVLSRASVCEVRSALSSLGLPAELVLHIMAIASYHPSVRTERSHDAVVAAQEGDGGCWAAQLYLVSAPLPARAPEDRFWQARKVSWEVQGHDQGWSTSEQPGHYRGWSWFDACIFRPTPSHTQTDDGGDEPRAASTTPTDVDMVVDGLYRTFFDARRGLQEVQELLRPAGWSMVAHGEGEGGLVWRLQNNRVAEIQAERHEFAWSCSVDGGVVDAEAREHGSGDGEGFVEALRPGDRVGIWMQAKYPGWACHAEWASVEIMYEFC